MSDGSNTADHAALSGSELLRLAESALHAGKSARAFELLTRAASVGVEPNLLHRLAAAYALAGRYQGRQADVLTWIEGVIAANTDIVQRAALLRARVAVCRQLDLERVLELAEEALAAAEKEGDETAYASVLASAAFAGYRRGDSRIASEYAERAAARTFTSEEAHYDCVRAQMFCASCVGDLEAALNYATKARAMAREMNHLADVANESNNLAEQYLELGCPAEARACAETAIALARRSGHASVDYFGQVMRAVATAEIGHIDEAIEQFDRLERSLDTNRIFAVDAATLHSYWLLERGAAGDAPHAREIAESGVALARASGVANRFTALYSNIARARAREGEHEQARVALEEARRAAATAEPRAQSLLALSVAEVMPVTEAKRKVALTNARARILRSAQRREDPRAFCNNVRLNRRLLELSGGVPDDLPVAE